MTEHQPGDFHRYGPILCEVCGQRGNFHLSIEPQTYEPLAERFPWLTPERIAIDDAALATEGEPTPDHPHSEFCIDPAHDVAYRNDERRP